MKHTTKKKKYRGSFGPNDPRNLRKCIGDSLKGWVPSMRLSFKALIENLIFIKILAGNSIPIHSRNVKSRNNSILTILESLQTIFVINIEEKITDFWKCFGKCFGNFPSLFLAIFKKYFLWSEKKIAPKIENIWSHVKHIQSRASNSFWAWRNLDFTVWGGDRNGSPPLTHRWNPAL